MTTRKDRTLDNRRNLKANGKGSEEYEVNYYGDETFLKIDAFQNEKNNLEARISGLEWRNKALIISVVVLLIFSLVIFALCLSTIHKQKMNSADSGSVEDNLNMRLGILETGLGDLEKRKTSDITLKGGDFWSYGNVFINGGPVCDDHWTSNEAMVVCKSLGFRMVTKKPCV